jgi:phosphoribosyl 1,2-cyclic phosphodiesterase
LELTFWGVRGTLPVANQRAYRYGGNTSCVTLEFPKGQLFIFDAGTGIKELSDALMKQNRRNIAASIFISHPHWDHINALPFFAPLYARGNAFEILGAAHVHKTMEELISAQMDDVYFPITMKEFGAQIKFRDLNEEQIEVEGISVCTMLLSHPGNCLGYRIDYNGRSVCYVTDNELFCPNPSSTTDTMSKIW